MGATINEIQEASNTDIKMNQEPSAGFPDFRALSRTSSWGWNSRGVTFCDLQNTPVLSPSTIWCMTMQDTKEAGYSYARPLRERVRCSRDERRVLAEAQALHLYTRFQLFRVWSSASSSCTGWLMWAHD